MLYQFFIQKKGKWIQIGRPYKHPCMKWALRCARKALPLKRVKVISENNAVRYSYSKTRKELSRGKKRKTTQK
jgi:hypothetical protein